MSKTNIEYFNYTFTLFIKDIIKIKGDYKETLEDYYKDLLETENCNDDKYIKRFMRKMSDHKKLICEKNNDLFNESLLILKNVDFHELWSSDGITPEYKDTIWEYIQTLYVLGETIISDSDKIKNLVENFKKIRNNEEVTVDNEEDNELINMIKNLSDNKDKENPIFDEKILENGLIGGLVKELAEDINLEDINLNLSGNSNNLNDVFSNLLSGDNPMNFMNLIQNVGQKIQKKLENADLDQTKLMEEAQNMMGMLGNNNPLFDNLLKNAAQSMQEEKMAEPMNPTQERLRKKLESRQNKK